MVYIVAQDESWRWREGSNSLNGKCEYKMADGVKTILTFLFLK